MIRVECILVVLPKFKVEKAFLGGWCAAINEPHGFEGCPVSIDENLYAEGTMNRAQGASSHCSLAATGADHPCEPAMAGYLCCRPIQEANDAVRLADLG